MKDEYHVHLKGVPYRFFDISLQKEPHAFPSVIEEYLTQKIYSANFYFPDPIASKEFGLATYEYSKFIDKDSPDATFPSSDSHGIRRNSSNMGIGSEPLVSVFIVQFEPPVPPPFLPQRFAISISFVEYSMLTHFPCPRVISNPKVREYSIAEDDPDWMNHVDPDWFFGSPNDVGLYRDNFFIFPADGSVRNTCSKKIMEGRFDLLFPPDDPSEGLSTDTGFFPIARKLCSSQCVGGTVTEVPFVYTREREFITSSSEPDYTEKYELIKATYNDIDENGDDPGFSKNILLRDTIDGLGSIHLDDFNGGAVIGFKTITRTEFSGTVAGSITVDYSFFDRVVSYLSRGQWLFNGRGAVIYDGNKLLLVD